MGDKKYEKKNKHDKLSSYIHSRYIHNTIAIVSTHQILEINGKRINKENNATVDKSIDLVENAACCNPEV